MTGSRRFVGRTMIGRGGGIGLLRGYALVSGRLTCRKEQSISHKAYGPYDHLLFGSSSFPLLLSMAGSTKLQVL